MATSLFDSTIYDGMFASHNMRLIFDERGALERWVRVEKAVSKVQGELGLIPTEAAAAITASLSAADIDLVELHADTRQVGRPIVGLARQLARQVPAPHAQWVHYGITTYDMMDSGTALQVGDGLALIRQRMRDLRGLWEALASEHRDTLMIGRTNGQHAQPSTFGARVATWLEEFVRHQERVDSAAQHAVVIQLGGMVGSLASVHPHGLEMRRAVAAELGIRAPLTNWHNARDALTNVAQTLGLVCASLARIARDIAAHASTDVGELYEAGESGRGRSSGMPHKRNPRSAEFAEATARLGRQRAAGMAEVMGQEYERSGGTYIAEWMLLPEVFLLTSAALDWSIDLFERLQVDDVRMRANIDVTRGLVLSERYTLFLATRMNKFEARKILDSACATVREGRCPLDTVLRRMPELQGVVTDDEWRTLADPGGYLGAAGDMVDAAVRASRDA